MDPWISFSGRRHAPLKGHDSKKGVRMAIRFARMYGKELHIFVQAEGRMLGQALYEEVSPSMWDETFAEES